MRAFILTTGWIFSVVGLAQLLRLIFGWTLQVAGVTIPVWVSVIPLAIAASMALWAFRVARGVGAGAR